MVLVDNHSNNKTIVLTDTSKHFSVISLMCRRHAGGYLAVLVSLVGVVRFTFPGSTWSHDERLRRRPGLYTRVEPTGIDFAGAAVPL